MIRFTPYLCRCEVNRGEDTEDRNELRLVELLQKLHPQQRKEWYELRDLLRTKRTGRLELGSVYKQQAGNLRDGHTKDKL